MSVSVPVDTLTPEHRHQLEVERGIPADLLAEERVYSLVAGHEPPVPDPIFRHDNTHKAERFPTWPDALTTTSSIVFPHRDHAGRSNPIIRPDAPRTVWDDDGNQSRPKYEACGGARLSVYITKRQRHLIEDITVPAVITEGDPKVMAAVGALGNRYLVLGLSGVDCWSYKPNPADKTELGPRGKVASQPLPDWDHIPLRSRIVFITFDSDRATNSNVQRAEERLVRFVKSRGGVPIVVQLPCKPDGSKMGIDDFVADGRDLGRHLHAALIGELSRPKRPEPPTGTDGEQTCQNCEPLREQLREHKLADQIRRSKAFPSGEVDVARHYSQQAAVAISQGKSEMPVWSEETERLTGASPATATRFHKAYKTFQDDPAIGPTLAWHLRKDTDAEGKDHYRVVVARIPEDPAERTVAAMMAPLAHLRRPDDRAGHGGARDACPKCQSPMTRTTYDVCQNDACGHMVTHPSKTVGRERKAADQEAFHDETAPRPTKIGGDFYAVEVQGQAPFHDEMKRERTYSEQDEMVRPTPLHDETGRRPTISMVTRDDMELADSPHYWGESPPEEPEQPIWEPPRIAPRSHIARAFRRFPPPPERPLPAVVGGSE